MKKESAVELKNVSLKVISSLSNMLEIKEQLSEEEYELIKKGIGIAIGEIQIRILDFIYSQYPELNDLD